ncbi:CREB-regulated transcription coactivator 1 [Holothuria leucospilota]|uniref:CREB-regulated transcription coactivator 1 n=1 Tax=Holothuria leucospilota TaxID=206669 RepID=A0A9Q1BLR4_HOLLE|nr:CREB-regulated transcription coactivator 1 [Holothuria leucospilota]
MMTSTSPRKFSEKIALHQQKQAEGNAAFNQIMSDVSYFTKNNPQQLVPNPRFHRGNSLPNVNQLGNQSLQMVNCIHACDSNIKPFVNVSNVPTVEHTTAHLTLDDKNASGRPGENRVHRTQRKVHMRHGTAPYSTPSYLSPPNDSSWRRTSSDSALHTSAMAGPPDHFPDMVENVEMVDARRGLTVWDAKKDDMVQNRPRSCEVPGIHICPSEQQQEPSSSPIPISSNTGSLPDLTNLHIPSPLTTPIDNEDPLQYSNPSPGSMSPGIPSPVAIMPNHLISGTAVQGRSPQLSPQLSPIVSPQTRRRDVPHLILATATDGQRVQCFPQSPQSAMSNVYDEKGSSLNYWASNNGIRMDVGSGISMDQSMNKFPIYQQTQQQGQAQNQQQQPHSPHSPHHQPPSPQHVSAGINLDMSKVALQYRDNKTPVHTCSSPTSPVPNPDYSPVPSPGGPVGSPGSVSPVQTQFNNSKGSFYHQQAAQNLPHQFEQISMVPESGGSPVGSPSVTQGMTNYTESYIYPPGDLDIYTTNRPPPTYPGQQFLQFAAHPTPNIPDIVFTGPDIGSPSSQDFAREIGNAMAGVDSAMDPIFSTDSLILDPLDLAGIDGQILSDNNPVADQATEDSFRSDHL